MGRISLAMIVKNEKKYLDRCLKSVKDIVDEIVIVDTGSTDNTIEIAKENGAKVYEHEWNNHFADARNKSIEYTTGEWILVLDADEYITTYDKEYLKKVLENKNQIGEISIQSRYMSDGEEYVAHANLKRLFPRGITFEGRIHEQLNTNLLSTYTGIEVNHDGYYQTEKFERNIPLLQKSLKENPKDTYICFQLARELKAAGKIKEASICGQKAYELMNKENVYSPVFIVEYLQILNLSKKYKEAIEIMNVEEQHMQEYAYFFYMAGMIYMEYLLNIPSTTIQDIKIIEKYYKKALEIGDNNKYTSVAGAGSYLPAYNLGVYYEVIGNKELAEKYFQLAKRMKSKLNM